MSRYARVFLFSVVVLNACRDDSGTPSEPTVASVTRAQQRVTTQDDLLAAVAAREPSFSGAWIENGELHVMLTDITRDRGSVRQAIRSVFTDPRLGGRPMVVRHGRYTFAQLAEWGKHLPGVFSLPGISFTDLDEVRNKIVVGVVSDDRRPAVLAYLMNRGIPAAAIEVVRRERAQLMQSGVSLGGVVRMIIGGVHMDFATAPNFCTIGFNTLMNGVPSFATNSHCSVSWGTPSDGTNYWQAFRTVPAQNIGAEGVGSALFTNSTDPRCPSPQPDCKWSDFAVGTYNAGMVSQQAYGYFARTTTRARFDSNLVINQSNPTIPIVSKSLFPFVGDTVDKVGARTGWTYGPVVQTCETELVVGPSQSFFFICAHRASLGVNGGDSGSGIFYYNPASGQATLAGQLFAGTDHNGQMFTTVIFAPLNNMQAEFGNIPATIYGN